MIELVCFLVGLAVSCGVGAWLHRNREWTELLARALMGAFLGVFLGMVAVSLLEANEYGAHSNLFLMVVCIAAGLSAQIRDS